MKHYLILTSLIAVFCIITSCKKSVEQTEVTLDKNLHQNADKYAALVKNRNSEKGSFTIENISRNDNLLTISVKGGCSEDDFHLVWDGSILFSYPGQINLVLYTETETGCGLEKQLDIKVNLSKILGNQNPKDFIYNVANGSLKQDKSLNTNGQVLTK